MASNSISTRFNLLCKSICIDDAQASSLRIYLGRYADFSVHEINSCRQKLSEAERKRAEKYHFNLDREVYWLSHAHLREELAKRLSVAPESLKMEFFSDAKPFVSGAKLDFNLSHSKKVFAFGIAESSGNLIGVDVEQVNNKVDYSFAFDTVMNKQEQAYVLEDKGDSNESRLRFYEIWTRKEAFLKLIGLGIITTLTNVSVINGDNTFEIMHNSADAALKPLVYIYTYRLKGAVLSVAYTQAVLPKILCVKSDVVL